ncbi:uncharacterized protein LOC120900585 isoform X2 [Anopheles arabiensis]|uniref:C2H2-type domain-containing protein n=1 Tax=Anopheles arabiensis TaxID=7173 RepID=A0A182HFV4_ANOAR|nr:uncharacterized protein LOC120900585 isoform X2 [Anopheles arabiensis]
MATSLPMALNTPKRLKTAVPPCANYLTTPPPSVSIGSPPIGTPTMANGQSHQTITTSGTTPLYVAGQSQQAWNHNNNNHWPSDATTTPTSSCGSPDGHWNRSYGSQGTPHTWNTSSGGSGSAEKPESKRGRPRSEALTTLMVEGSISPSSIKCHYCNRVFPREKSLQAHLRTHTGERPYQCDYPGCKRAFTQSGQLKTHQRLHTGERPFICSVAHCQMRFTHANRHCPDHPLETLKRCDDFVIQALPEQNTEVLKWLEKYRAEREDRTPTRKTPIKRTNSPDGVGSGPENGNGAASSATQNENENRRQDTAQRSATNNENHLPLGVNGSGNGLSGGVSTGNGALGNNHQLLASPVTPNNTYKSIRKGLMDMNACMGLTSPVTTKAKNSLPKLIQWQEPTSQEENESGDECCVPSKQSTFNPKKKWLRDAWQEDLAKPLEPNLISPKLFASTTSTMALKQQLHQESVVTISPSKRQLLGVIGHNKPLPRMEGIGHSTSAPAPVVTSVAPPPPAPFNPNQTRPTVLMVASKDSARPLSVKPAAELLANEITANGTCLSPKPEENNRKLQGALALMQLAAKDAFLQDAYEVPSVPEALLAHGTTLLCGRSPVEATNNGSTLAVNGFTTTEATVQEKCP